MFVALTLRYALAYNPVRLAGPTPLWLPPGGIAILDRLAHALSSSGDGAAFFSVFTALREAEPVFSGRTMLAMPGCASLERQERLSRRTLGARLVERTPHAAWCGDGGNALQRVSPCPAGFPVHRLR
jgi:hypothetical protein